MQRASRRARGRSELSGAMMAISTAGVGEDGVGGDSRAGERSGLVLLEEEEGGGARVHGRVARGRRRARLRRRCGGGGVGHGEGERGRRGRRGWCVQGLGATTWSASRPAGRRGGETGRRGAAWRSLVPASSTCVPAWPSQAARWRGSWAGPAGGPVGRRQVSFPFIFPFLFFCNFV